jgi:hypothetical protein
VPAAIALIAQSLLVLLAMTVFARMAENLRALRELAEITLRED